MAVNVRIRQKEATSDRPARVRIYENGKLVAEVIVNVELKQNAVGGFSPCVTLEKK